MPIKTIRFCSDSNKPASGGYLVNSYTVSLGFQQRPCKLVKAPEKTPAKTSLISTLI